MEKKLTTIIAEGDLRKSLEAIRDHLAGELEQGTLCKQCGGVVSSPTAQLSKQLADVLERLDSLPGEEASQVDEIARRRADRLAGSDVSKRAGVPADGSRRGNRSRRSGRTGS